MIRPCFLVADREYASSISTRKLVIETAKLNVITTYSASETIETLKKFPNIDGIIIDADIQGMSFEELIAQLKTLQPKAPVILIRNPHSDYSRLADHQLDSFQPAKLLELLQSLQPEKTEAIEKHNERLAKEQN
jgi:CheY-like chemotaxis protein